MKDFENVNGKISFLVRSWTSKNNKAVRALYVDINGVQSFVCFLKNEK